MGEQFDRLGCKINVIIQYRAFITHNNACTAFGVVIVYHNYNTLMQLGMFSNCILILLGWLFKGCLP